MPNDTIQPAKSAKPLVSVIIPVYNGERYLAQAVDSVLAQTYRPVEIIVVDDGSTDGTAAVLEPYRNRIRYVFQANQGVSVARNAGLTLAQGEFVLFLDADDYLCLSTMFEEMLELFESKPDIDIVHSGWCDVDEGGEILQEYRVWLDIPKLDLEAWFKWAPARLNAMIVRRTCLQTIGDFNPTLKTNQDIQFLLRLSLAGCQFRWLPKITACYRQRQTSLSHSNIPLSIDQGLQVREDLLARPDLPDNIRNQRQLFIFGYLLWGLDRLLTNQWHDQAIMDHLVKLLNRSPYRKNEAAYDIVAQLSKFEYLRRGKCEHSDRLAIILAKGNSSLNPAGLQWWGQVWWWYYLNRQSREVARMIAPYHTEVVKRLQDYSLAERSQLAQAAMIGGVNLIYGDGLAPVEVVELFRRDAELTTARSIYLAYLWRLVKTRHWQAATQILPKIWQG